MWSEWTAWFAWSAWLAITAGVIFFDLACALRGAGVFNGGHCLLFYAEGVGPSFLSFFDRLL
jgi:hypothetical protein